MAIKIKNFDVITDGYIHRNPGDFPLWENTKNFEQSYTITNNYNAMSVGPITINSGVTVTIGDGETWTIV